MDDLGAAIALIGFAYGLDAWLGDPVYRWHPIRLLGMASLILEQRLFTWGWHGYAGGVVHWLIIVGGALTVWSTGHSLLAQLAPLLAWAFDLYIAYSLLCLRDLLTHGRRVLATLDDLPQARIQVGMLVGRDTSRLARGGVVRATIESLAENLTDGVLTPIWALCLFGLPGIIVVKAISNLDSMIGYRDARYARYGWLSARSDDLMHWLPARLAVPVIVAAAFLVREYPRSAWTAARRYHALLPSPNSGWSEAACAGALQVRLLGPIWRDAQLVTTVYMGEPAWPADLDGSHLRRALRLTAVSGALAVLLGLGLLVLGSALARLLGLGLFGLCGIG